MTLTEQIVTITATIPEDIFEVSSLIRAVDRDECRAAAGWTPEEALWAGLHSSDECLTGRVGSEIVAIFGVVPQSLIAGIGVPWMLGTDAIERHARTFLCFSRPIVNRWASRYPALVNYVDARNTTAIRWLEWLDFAIEPSRPHGPLRQPFHRFIRRTPRHRRD